VSTANANDDEFDDDDDWLMGTAAECDANARYYQRDQRYNSILSAGTEKSITLIHGSAENCSRVGQITQQDKTTHDKLNMKIFLHLLGLFLMV